MYGMIRMEVELNDVMVDDFRIHPGTEAVLDKAHIVVGHYLRGDNKYAAETHP